MKKIILLLLLALAGIGTQQAKAQITLEHTYDSASVFASGIGGSQLQTFAGGLFFMVILKLKV
ncbi:MAG: hypothetical protein WCL14_00240 [Bacteroidota bacterium]